jgi:DNA-binding transcriptional regulator YiaG
MQDVEERAPGDGTKAVRTRPAVLCINGDRLQAIRLDMEVSQAEFAELVKQAGKELGHPNACTKRLVQSWEAGGWSCRPNYRRALRRVTGLSYAQLCAETSQTETATPCLSTAPDAGTDRTTLAVLGEVSMQLARIQAWLEQIALGIVGS